MNVGFSRLFALWVVVVLVSCAQGGQEPPETVLERAALTAQQLDSAAFDGTVSYTASQPGTGTMRIEADLDGNVAAGGQQVQFSVDGSMTMPTGGFDQTVSLNADVLVAGEDEVYIRFGSIEGNVLFLPGVGLVSPDMLDKWFSIGTAAAGEKITPDPSLLTMQTQVLKVLSDRSYEEVDGHKCFTYDVAIDTEKMLSYLERIALEQGKPFERESARTFLEKFNTKGTIWIDEESSVIRRISWVFESKEEPRTGFSFSIRLSKHNEPVVIAPPTDAVPFPSSFTGATLPAL